MASDATWPTEFADFKRLDAVLKCGICYDYMTNCMITSCSHTYCSLCIRKFMQYKNQCPACFEETYEVHLRNNRPLDEVIAIFVKMKDRLQRALRLATIPIPMKVEARSVSKEEPTSIQKTPQNRSSFEPKTPSSVRTNVRAVSVHLFNDKSEDAPTDPRILPGSSINDKTTKNPTTSQSDKAGDDLIFNGVKIPGIFNAPISFPKVRKPDEMAQCPVCEVDVPARNINIHLDSCLAAESGVRSTKPKNAPRREPIPKRLFNLLKDPALKKILKDYGLNTQGDRKTLISRIQRLPLTTAPVPELIRTLIINYLFKLARKRYTVIYNSENDSPNPRPVSELVAQLEREEREEKKPNALMKSLARQQPQRIVIDRKADPEVIDQANKAYRDENKESFRKLIEKMREREGKNIKPIKPPPRVYSDDEDDPNRCVVFNPSLPSTSRDDPSSSGDHSVYSQATQHYSDSDSDIFQGNDDAEKTPKKGLIDWSKTSIAEKETIVVSESEGEIDGPTVSNPVSVQSSDGEQVISQEEPVSHIQPREQHVTPIKTPSRALHILLSPSESEKLADEQDSNDLVEDPNKTGIFENSVKFNARVEQVNRKEAPSNDDSANTANLGESNTKMPAVNVGTDGGSDDSVDALFDEESIDQTVTPRVTRSCRKSVGRSESSTPNSTSSRGTKRKSKGSPKSATTSNLQDTFDFLFEKYNGDRIDDNIESDQDDATSSSTSNSVEPEEATGTKSLHARRSLRNRRNMTPLDKTSEPNHVATRKRAKRDLSPAF